MTLLLVILSTILMIYTVCHLDSKFTESERFKRAVTVMSSFVIWAIVICFLGGVYGG